MCLFVLPLFLSLFVIFFSNFAMDSDSSCSSPSYCPRPTTNQHGASISHNTNTHTTSYSTTGNATPFRMTLDSVYEVVDNGTVDLITRVTFIDESRPVNSSVPERPIFTPAILKRKNSGMLSFRPPLAPIQPSTLLTSSLPASLSYSSPVYIPPPCPSAPKRSRVRAPSPTPNVSTPPLDVNYFLNNPSPPLPLPHTPVGVMSPLNLDGVSDALESFSTEPDRPNITTISPNLSPIPHHIPSSLTHPSPVLESTPKDAASTIPEPDFEDGEIIHTDLGEDDTVEVPVVDPNISSPPWITRARDQRIPQWMVEINKYNDSLYHPALERPPPRCSSCLHQHDDTEFFKPSEHYVRCDNFECEKFICYHCWADRSEAWNELHKEGHYHSLDFLKCPYCADGGLSMNLLHRLFRNKPYLKILFEKHCEVLTSFISKPKP